MIQISGFAPSHENVAALNLITHRLAAKDSTLWGAAAEKEAAIRLNWIDLPTSLSSTILYQIGRAHV